MCIRTVNLLTLRLKSSRLRRGAPAPQARFCLGKEWSRRNGRKPEVSRYFRMCECTKKVRTLYVHSRSQNIGVARLYVLLYVHLEMHSQIREKYVVHLYVRMLLCLYVHMY